MIAAQVISIIAFLISWTWWVTFVISFASMVFLQIIWCCRQNKCGVYASAGVAALAGITSFIAGIIMLVHWKDKTCCEVFTFTEQYRYYGDNEDDNCREGAWSIVAFVTGIMWFAVAGCIFYFVKSGRHAKWEEKLCNRNNSGEGGATATATAIEMGSVSPTTTASASASATIPTAAETLPPAAVAAAAATVLPEIPNKVDNV